MTHARRRPPHAPLQRKRLLATFSPLAMPDINLLSLPRSFSKNTPFPFKRPGWAPMMFCVNSTEAYLCTTDIYRPSSPVMQSVTLEAFGHFSQEKKEKKPTKFCHWGNISTHFMRKKIQCQMVQQLRHTPSIVMLQSPNERKKQAVVTEVEQWYLRRSRRGWVVCLFVSVRRGPCLEYRSAWSKSHLTLSIPESDAGANRIFPRVPRTGQWKWANGSNESPSSRVSD